MSSTTFVDGATAIVASWLNDVNLAAYTTVPTLVTNLTTLTNSLPTSYARKTGATGTTEITSGTTGQRSTTLGVGIRYNTDLASFEGYNGSAWGSIGGGATGAGGDTVFQLNKLIVTTSYSLPTGSNAMVVGPLTINSGVTLTIPSGQRLVVL